MFRYEIYQLDLDYGELIVRDFAFRGYEEVERDNLEIKKDPYKLVYTLEANEELSLDDLFYIFNMQRPEDYRGRSLSVSDVVKNDEGYWYCDSVGWVKLDWNEGEGE